MNRSLPYHGDDCLWCWLAGEHRKWSVIADCAGIAFLFVVVIALLYVGGLLLTGGQP